MPALGPSPFLGKMGWHPEPWIKRTIGSLAFVFSAGATDT
jgi:hypothetical protein